MVIRFMSRGEIAEYLGVSLATAKQYVDFPPPDAIIGRNQGWTRETIDQWVAKRAKRK
jgi:predicted DNA-binding transcriptional regulator AlpA